MSTNSQNARLRLASEQQASVQAALHCLRPVRWRIHPLRVSHSQRPERPRLAQCRIGWLRSKTSKILALLVTEDG